METSETKRETSGETSVKSSNREHPSRETSKGTSGDKCKNIRPCVSGVGRGNISRRTLIRPRTQSVLGQKGDEWETSVKSCGPSTQSVLETRETSVKSRGQSSRVYPERRETSGRQV